MFKSRQGPLSKISFIHPRCRSGVIREYFRWLLNGLMEEAGSRQGKRDIEWTWVRGHDGDPMNEYAVRVANDEAARGSAIRESVR